MGLIQCRGIIDALAALLTGKGVDHQVRRADQPGLHRGRRLDRQQFLHQWCIQAAAKVGEHFREHNMRLGTIDLDLSDPTGSPSPPSRFAIGYRSVHRSSPTHVSGVPTPTAPVSRRADVHAWYVWGSAGRTSGPRPRPGPPTEPSRPIGEWDVCQGRSLPPAGAVLGPSANAEGSGRAAWLGSPERGRKRASAYDDPIHGTIPFRGNKLVVTM